MKKLTLSFITAFILSVIIGSCSSKFDGKNGIKIVHFPGTDKICQEIEYKDGKKNGALKEYYENGNLKTVQHFQDDLNNDSAIFYHKNGKIAAIQIAIKGKNEGCWKKFNEQGVLYSEINFKDGVFDGTSTTFTYKTGKVLERFNFKDGMKEGKQEVFYNNGNPKSVTYYHYGNPCLGTEEWEENGKKIDNDFKINVIEQNRVLLEDKLKFYIQLENPQTDDEAYQISLDTSKVLNRIYGLTQSPQGFLLEFNVAKGGFVMEKVRIAAARKTLQGNVFIKTTTFNASANNY